jgi:putative hydrolase of the HAD superfamily
MRRYPAIGFDLDNTLYDQGQHMRSFFREAAAYVARAVRCDPSAAEAAFVDTWKRRTSYYPHLFDEALGLIEVSDGDLVRVLVALYHQHRADLTLFHGVRELLARLRSRHALFLITDGNAEMQRGKLESLGITEAFDELVLTGAFGRAWAKPATAPFEHVLARLGGDSQDYVYVGDNPACDFYGARQLGIRTVRVMTEPFKHVAPPSRDHEADVVLENTIDLEQVLDDPEATV